MTNNDVYIPSLDAKDLYISNNYGEYSLKNKSGQYRLNKFINTQDYSLELIKLREEYQKAYRKTDFGFVIDKKEYSTNVINITFKYSVKPFNRINPYMYVKFGFDVSDMEFNDCICVVDGELVGIKIGEEVLNPATSEILGKYFYYVKDESDVLGHYEANVISKTLFTVADLRADLYKNGFYVDGIHYVRFKRSSGSSRVGKCLFINEKLYGRMHRWEKCGLTIRQGQKIDLAGWESSISLTCSSIIGTIEIKPENILLIDDYESVFEDDVIATRAINDRLVSKPERVTISNKIWDGQSLIDISIMCEYSKYGMILLRNRFFKSCSFNTNIQKWFADNGITDIKQLNGKTRAKNISDIKLITTPSSIKFLKFGDLDTWLDNVSSTFGVVKHEKPTHFFGGDMVQTHYQLINTLQMSEKEVEDFVKPSMDYLKLIRNDSAVLKHYLKMNNNQEDEVFATAINNNNDIVFKMLTINDDFIKTKICNNFINTLSKSFIKDLKNGHVLVNGNYSTMIGNPVEMLQSAIGTFDGSTSIPNGHICSTRFNNGEKILGSRSPHVTVGNILLTTNIYIEEISKYFNFTKEIVAINSILENILNRLSGAD